MSDTDQQPSDTDQPRGDTADQPFRFEVAFSLAGQQLAAVQEIDRRLSEHLGHDRVFFYPRHEALIAGPNADLTLTPLIVK